jgi:hypothetical protein
MAPVSRMIVVDYQHRLLSAYQRRGYVETLREPVKKIGSI